MPKIGERIKQLRSAANLSIDTLAQKSLMTQEQLQIIEDNNIIPSLSVIVKIAHGLEIPVGTILDGSEQSDFAITRKDDGKESVSFTQSPEAARNNSFMSFYSLAPGKTNRNMEPFTIDMQRTEDDVTTSSHEGEEFIYVLKGQVEFTYGENVSILKEGDSVYFDSIVPHKFRSSVEKSKVIAVMYTPC